MATTHTFKAKSVQISVTNEAQVSVIRECSLLGSFVLNGNVNKDGVVHIERAAADAAIFFANPPALNIAFNVSVFEALSQLLCAADNVKISFISNTDLFLDSLGGHQLESFDISPGRTYE